MRPFARAERKDPKALGSGPIGSELKRELQTWEFFEMEDPVIYDTTRVLSQCSRPTLSDIVDRVIMHHAPKLWFVREGEQPTPHLLLPYAESQVNPLSTEADRLDHAPGGALGFRIRTWAQMSINASTQIVSPGATTRLASSSCRRQFYSHIHASTNGLACQPGLLVPRPLFPIHGSATPQVSGCTP